MVTLTSVKVTREVKICSVFGKEWGILTIKMLNKLKISFSLIHQRMEITGQTTTKTKEKKCREYRSVHLKEKVLEPIIRIEANYWWLSVNLLESLKLLGVTLRGPPHFGGSYLQKFPQVLNVKMAEIIPSCKV